MKKLFLIRYVLVGNRQYFLLLLLSGLITNVLMSTTDPLLTKALIDNVTRHNFRPFLLLAVGVVIFGAAVRVALLIYGLACQRLQNRVTQTLTLRMLSKYYGTSYSEISHASNGYFVSRIYDEPAKIAQGIITVWLSLFTSVISLIGSLAVALFLSWRITAVLAAIIPFLYYLSRKFSPKIRMKSQAENEGEARLREFLGRATESYKTVKIFDLVAATYARVSDSLRAMLDIMYSRARISRSYQTLSMVFLSFAETLVLVASGYAVLRGELTLGGLFGFMNAFWKLNNAGLEIVRQLPEISRQQALIQRLVDFESLPDEVPSMSEPYPAGANVVECRSINVSLGNNLILENANLSVGSNERLLIIGPNGSGKTTIANMLARFVVASSGSVKAPQRARISAMLMPFHFVPGTLLDNVNFQSLSLEKRDVFERMVDQLGLRDRLLADISATFSEGEKRKCQILMSLLKDADLYIFDEPLANIDTENKHLILQIMLDYTVGKSIICIMHGDCEYWSVFDRVADINQISVAAATAAG